MTFWMRLSLELECGHVYSEDIEYTAKRPELGDRRKCSSDGMQDVIKWTAWGPVTKRDLGG